jgi:hypothetical protein
MSGAVASQAVQRAVEKGYAEITTDVSGIASTTYVDVGGLSITFVAGTRPIEVEFFSPKLLESVLGTVMTFQICSLDAVTTYVEGVWTSPVANGQSAWSLKRVLRTLTPGTSFSMKLQVKVSSGAGFIGATAPKGPAFLSALER